MLPIAQFYALKNVTLKFWAFGLLYTIVRFRHIGIDIGTGRKAIDVPALLGGTVVAVVRTGSMGMVVVLKVGARYYAYCHLANINLPDEGDVIRQGQRVGQLAWTKDPKSVGYAGTAWKGIHLHLVISNRADGAYRYPKARDAEFFDPAPVIADVLAPKPAPKPAGQAKPSSNQRVVRSQVLELNGRAGASTSTSNSGKPIKAKVTGNFTGFVRGQRVTIKGVTSNIWFRGTSGRYFAAAGFTSQSVVGLKDLGTWKAPAKPAPAKPKPAAKPKPKPKPKKHPAIGRTLHLPTFYWYDHPTDAANHADKHGKRRGESMLSGPYTVLDVSSLGAYEVKSKANGVVWVSPLAKKYLR